MRLLLSLAAAVPLLVLAPHARATEGQLHLGGGVGVGSFASTDDGMAPALGIHAVYELDDMFDAALELGASQHEFIEGQTTRFYSVLAGFSYKVDVIEWVPYFGLYGGYFRFDGPVWPEPLQEQEWGIAVPLGLDYSPSRHFAVGAQLRYHGFLSDPLSSLGDAPYFLALLRAEYRFGW